MSWTQNKNYSGDTLNSKFNGKTYRKAGRAKNKTELNQAKKYLKTMYGSVRTKKSVKQGYVLYVNGRK